MEDFRYTERLGYVLKRAQQALRAAMDEQLREMDLTAPQYAALSALGRTPSLSNAELARACFVTPQTMHQIVQSLESSGVIERGPHPEDGRIQQISLTEEGSDILHRAHDCVDAIEARMAAPLSVEEKRCLSEGLRKCSEALSG